KTSCPFCFQLFVLPAFFATLPPFPPFLPIPPEKKRILSPLDFWRRRMKGRRFVKLGAAALALAIAAGGGAAMLSQSVAAQGRGGQAPRLDVDPLWPKPFPVEKHWALGSVTGVAVDAQDHVWVSNRGTESLQNNEKGPTLQPWASECCFGAPQVLEFDAAGTLLNSWGGPGQGY